MDALPICGKPVLALDFRPTSPIAVPVESGSRGLRALCIVIWRAGFTVAQKLHPDHLAALLDRLGPDRDLAGERYIDLARRLRTIFLYRHCPDVDELVDETLDRAGRRLLELGDRFEGSDPARYVFGVAWNVARESFRRRSSEPLSEDREIPDPGSDDADESKELRDTCLDRCLGQLSAHDRRLALQYYEGEGGTRVRRRAELARDRGVSLNALRLKVHRLTRHLRQCVFDCVGGGGELALAPIPSGPHLVKG
jgi:DNA-directed RNA polymerase specialized sigma24 family protein